MSLLLQPNIEEFKDLTAPVDEPAVWEATIKGNPKPEITWLKSNEELTMGDEFDTEEDRRNNKYKLLIKNVNVEHGGTYTVFAKNYLGESSAQALLTAHRKLDLEKSYELTRLYRSIVRCLDVI